MASGIEFSKVSQDEIYRKIYQAAQDGAYVSYLRGKRCADEQAFFYEVSASFQFPWYFGENWAAFDECICDLEWIAHRSIFLVVDDFSKMFNGNVALQELLLKYLVKATDYWESEGVKIEIVLNR